MVKKFTSPVLLITTALTRLVFIFVLFIVPFSVQASSFEEALKYANLLRDKIKIEGGRVKVESDHDEVKPLIFVPEEVFKNQKGGYTNNPSLTNHYQESKKENSQALKRAGMAEADKDENYIDAKGNPVPTPGKVVTKAFNKREVFKITPGSEYVKKGRLVKDNANNIVGGISNKHIDCDKNKMSTCKIIHVEEKCNEEIRTVKRTCEKTPKVDVTVNDVIYPNCQNIVVKTGWHTSCPAEYTQILYSDMIKGPAWDDIRLCTKTMSNSEGYECFAGYLVRSIYHDSYTKRTVGPGKGVVPKKMHGRIKFSNTYDGHMVVTIINETTGKTLHSSGHFKSGQVVELPFSKTQDQSFKFVISNPHYIGIMILYVDHMSKDRIVNINWEEVCRDV